MLFLISGICFGVFCIGYAIYSTVTAKYEARRNEGYRNKVNEYTVKQGYPLSSNYEHLEVEQSEGYEHLDGV